MIKALKYFWKEQPIALSALVLALCVLIFFGVRFVFGFVYFHDPAHRNEALQPWMTPKYVGMSYRLPPEIIRQVMQLEAFEGRRVKLSDVVERMDITLPELEARVRAAKSALQQEKGRPGHQKQKPAQSPEPASEPSRVPNGAEQTEKKDGAT
ncbi:hypothetical protein [uncultured Cohaesibacter sp.]|uniref:hypothetical protein n=1 Tax=uncultured Cohaesibacter sp. TaxID=1002546 RepID=UPI0029C6F85C|nr:hypothetical protein [uncultured Cohaesibacter sp.]